MGSVPGSSAIKGSRIAAAAAQVGFSPWPENLHMSKLQPLKKSLQITNAGKGVERRKSSLTVGGNVNWYNHYGKQYGISLEN